jgi:glutamine amidotransferase
VIRAGVLDYGLGNLRSVAKALEAVGADVVVTDSPTALSKRDLLVLPGQGSFATAMDVLRQRDLTGFVQDWIGADRPYLGICLGLQLLFERSEEAPGKKGLGVLKGWVRKFRLEPGLKIPHMGWNRVEPQKANVRGANAPLPKADDFYFVHSYYVVPTDPSVVWTETSHGRTFCSAVARGSLVATQFHPEKSGQSGQLLLKRILRKLC